MSATQSWFMPLATNSRFTKSGAGRWRLLRSLVTHHARLRLTPWMCIARINAAIRLRLA